MAARFFSQIIEILTSSAALTVRGELGLKRARRDAKGEALATATEPRWATNADRDTAAKTDVFSIAKAVRGRQRQYESLEGLRARKNPREASMQPPSSRGGGHTDGHGSIFHTNFNPSGASDEQARSGDS